MIYILVSVKILQFPSEQLSGYIKLGACRKKDDCVRSCLIELQSCLLSKFDVNPIHRVLMFLPHYLLVLCKTQCSQVDRLRILVFFVHRIHRQKEYCLSVAQIFDLPVSIQNL